MSRARDLADLGDGIAVADLPSDVVTTASPSLGRRNLIINGAMQVAQRGPSFTNLANGSYGLDRFSVTKITGAVVDILQTSDAPTASEAGYLLTHCLHADVTTADTAVAASDMYGILQAIEYKNIVQAGFSQSGTRYLTASFWVKSTKTGTFCCFIKSADHARAYVKEYTVSATDTWEHKTLTFPVDTSGGASWNHNDVGATLGWALYGGTNYQITADVWTTTSSNYAPCTVNQVNALDSASNNFKITGVQLEVGSVATPFEHRSYGEELALCQRYTWVIKSSSAYSLFGPVSVHDASNANAIILFPQTIRATPTLGQSGSFSIYSGDGGDGATVGGIDGNTKSPYGVVLNLSGSGFTDNSAGFLRGNNDTSASISFFAEL